MKNMKSGVDWKKVTDSIAGSLAAIGEPLTDPQKIVLAGSLAVWLEHVYETSPTLGELRHALAELELCATTATRPLHASHPACVKARLLTAKAHMLVRQKQQL